MGSGMRLNKKLAMVFAGVDIICGIAVYTNPNLAHAILKYLTHSTWQFTINPFSIVDFAIGALLWAVIGYLFGSVLEGPASDRC